MALALTVKFSSVNNLSDARYGAGMGVTFMGFDLSPTFALRPSLEQFHAITGWLAGVDFVAEFQAGTSLEDIIGLAKAYAIEHVEVQEAALISLLQAEGFTVFLKTELSDLGAPSDTVSLPDYLHITGKKDELDKHLSDIKAWNKQVPVLLDAGLEADALLELNKASVITGLAVAGGDEIRPGYKDFDALADLLEPLEID
jgi:phosphoribosylanthranilate isomerase